MSDIISRYQWQNISSVLPLSSLFISILACDTSFPKNPTSNYGESS